LPSQPVRRGRWRKPPRSQDFLRCWWQLSNPCWKLATSQEGHVVWSSSPCLTLLSVKCLPCLTPGEPISIDLSPLITLICQLAHLYVCSRDLCTRYSPNYPMHVDPINLGETTYVAFYPFIKSFRTNTDFCSPVLASFIPSCFSDLARTRSVLPVV
jgi:hypothetical protein